MRADNVGLARIMFNMQSRHGTLLKQDKNEEHYWYFFLK